jgi:autotransporter-associated beta strand protein
MRRLSKYVSRLRHRQVRRSASCLAAALLLVALGVLRPISAGAATRYWDVDSTTNGLQNGTGAWNTTTVNWATTNGTGNLTNTTYANGDDVHFENSKGSAAPFGGTITVVAGGVTPGSITVDASTVTDTFAGGAIGGTGTFSLINGIVILQNANTYSGGTIVTGGTLELGISGVVSAGGAITSGPVGKGTLTLANGITLSSDGTTARSIQNNLSLSGNITLGDATRTGTLTFNSTDGTNTLTTAATVTLTAATTLTTASAVNIADAVSGGFTLTKAGTSTLTLSGAAANTYSGVTTVNAGELDLNKTAGVNAIAGDLTIGDGTGTDTVKLLASDQIANTSVVTLTNAGSAVLNLNNQSEVIGSLTDSTTGASTSAVQLGTGTLTFGDSSNRTYGGVISGTGGNIVKQGSGTQTLSGTNSYSGTTTINGGTLTLDNNNSTTTGRLQNTSGITVNSGGTLLLAQSSGGSANTDRINDSAGVTLSGGGTFKTGGLSEGTRPTNSGSSNGVAGMGALTLTSTSSVSHATFDFLAGANGSSLVFGGSPASLVGGNGAFVDIKFWTGTAGSDNSLTGNDRLLFAINPSLTNAQLANYQFFNDAGTAFAIGGTIIAYGNEFELVPVPEPSTWVAAALALIAIGFSQLRKRSRAGGKRIHALCARQSSR